LYEKLIKVDPVSAERIHSNDTQRILRALEVWELTGVPLSQFQQTEQEAADFNPIFIGLTMDRTRLYQRIEHRVDSMIEQGLVHEVAQLKKMGYSDGLISLQTVGYKEVFQYLKGDFSYDNMIDLIKQKSRNYAKRQLTWFRKDERINWFDAEKLGDKKSKILLDFFLKIS
jgi:tRNA dimethylallyltransferase